MDDQLRQLGLSEDVIENVKSTITTIVLLMAFIILLLTVVPLVFVPVGATMVDKNGPCDEANETTDPNCKPSVVKNRTIGMMILIVGCVLSIPMLTSVISSALAKL